MTGRCPMDVRLGLATPHFVMGEGQARFRSQPHDGVAIVVLQLALAMVFAVTRRRWAAAFDSDGTHNYGVFEGGAVEDGAVEDGAVGRLCGSPRQVARRSAGSGANS